MALLFRTKLKDFNRSKFALFSLQIIHSRMSLAIVYSHLIGWLIVLIIQKIVLIIKLELT